MGNTCTARKPAHIPESERRSVLDGDLSLDAVARLIKDKEVKNVVVMCGAGISVAAGIPDFRSPKTGLYDNLAKYNLPRPEAIFTLDYFHENPEPFFKLAQELMPGSFVPTRTHYFLRLLASKGILRRVFTQNIDTLERVAGVPDDKIVEVHGSFQTSTCTGCRMAHSLEWMREKVKSGVIPTCDKCGATVKPDITFFGESLPDRYGRYVRPDTEVCDLLLVIGTSLQVAPVSGLPDMVDDLCPRVLINREPVSVRTPVPDDASSQDSDDWQRDLGTFMFGDRRNYRDVFAAGDCDDTVDKFAELLGWKKELDKLVKRETAKLRKQMAADSGAADASDDGDAGTAASTGAGAGAGVGAGPGAGAGSATTGGDDTATSAVVATDTGGSGGEVGDSTRATGSGAQGEDGAGAVGVEPTTTGPGAAESPAASGGAGEAVDDVAEALARSHI